MKGKDSKYKASSQHKGQPGWKEVSEQEKRYYGFDQIKIRIKSTEILRVFFCVHAAIAQRIATN